MQNRTINDVKADLGKLLGEISNLGYSQSFANHIDQYYKLRAEARQLDPKNPEFNKLIYTTSSFSINNYDELREKILKLIYAL